MGKDCGFLERLPTGEKVNKNMSQNNFKPEIMCVGNNSDTQSSLGHKVRFDGF